MQVSDLALFVADFDAPEVAPLLGNLQSALDNLVRIGLGYPSLNRESSTLSGGVAQRVKMVRHLGSSLTDLTYVFDEPTIGLHPRHVQNMNDLLLRLRDKGNTVLVAEHKPEMITIADRVVDLGPGAGQHGGTTGLHMHDVDILITLLDRLVDRGRTVIVIEHNLDVIARTDRVIDLGPGAGHDGGRVVFEGPPLGLIEVDHSVTGQHLRKRLGR